MSTFEKAAFDVDWAVRHRIRRNRFAGGMILVGGLLSTLGIWVGCGGGGHHAETCGPDTCAQGCCRDGECTSSSDQTCGVSGQACQDCTAIDETDTCDQGACICRAAGQSCDPGEICLATGCSNCHPDCADKCVGADDGCNGTCQINDCAGCCNDQHQCVSSANQTASQCGTGGESCADCTSSDRTDVCNQGTCVCQATGQSCPSGQNCTQTGCSNCHPDCSEKCAGANDGCGGSCQDSDCSGCCDANAQCVAVAQQSDAACGLSAETCRDCRTGDWSCNAGRCLSVRDRDAAFLSEVVPASVSLGGQFQVTVTMRNVGRDTWTAADQYRLGAQRPQDNATWGLSRVELSAAESIATGQDKTFSFSVTAPSSPGFYDFEWRMLKEGVAWFGQRSEPLRIYVGTEQVEVCEAARALANQQTDASSTIQACIDAAPAGAFVELPAGRYQLDHQILIASHPVTFRTEQTTLFDPPCDTSGTGCAVLVASTSFADTSGVLRVLQNGAALDHIVVDGNKSGRSQTASAQHCASYDNQYGYNIQMVCDDCSLTNSVTQNALCGTGCEVSGVRHNVLVWRNTIASNGVHDHEGMWSDGLTVHDGRQSVFCENRIMDNTDVDLIFGGCVDCEIRDNVLSHSTAFASSSFAAVMLHAWPDGNGGNGTSGDYTGTDTVGNVIDCGTQHRCGIGLYLGSDAWYITDVHSGTVFGNVVDRAQQGLLIDDVHDMIVFDNVVAHPAQTSTASCGTKATNAYGIGTRSHDVDFSQDRFGTQYTSVDWDGCIPNWWNP